MEQRGSSRLIAGLTRDRDTTMTDQRKAAFRLRSVAVFMLGYAGIAQCEYRDGNESDAPPSGVPPPCVPDS
jgi:hypothetical protein